MIGLFTSPWPSSAAVRWHTPISPSISHAAPCRFNAGEPAVLFCFIFLLVAARGGGLLSVGKD